LVFIRKGDWGEEMESGKKESRSQNPDSEVGIAASKERLQSNSHEHINGPVPDREEAVVKCILEILVVPEFGKDSKRKKRGQFNSGPKGLPNSDLEKFPVT